jgi:phytoene/squalene synthetase
MGVPQEVTRRGWEGRESDDAHTHYATKKEVPQHTYGGAGGRGCIAPTHSRLRY